MVLCFFFLRTKDKKIVIGVKKGSRIFGRSKSKSGRNPGIIFGWLGARVQISNIFASGILGKTGIKTSGPRY